MTHPHPRAQAHAEVLVNQPPYTLSGQDAVAWLRDQPEESVDLLITDQAY